MKIFEVILLFFEILSCAIIVSRHNNAFGQGKNDFFYFCLFYLSVTVHFEWSIYSTVRLKTFKLQVIIFSVLTLFFLSKATIFRRFCISL